MIKPLTNPQSDVEFLSPTGQRRREAMFHELTTEMSKVQTQRRTRRRITFTACSTILLVAVTTWAISIINNHQFTGPSHRIVVENNAPPSNQIEVNETPDEQTVHQNSSPASYITRTHAGKSTRWTTISTAAIQSDRSIQRVQRVESDDELLQLLRQAGYESAGLIRTEGRTVITGDTTAFKTTQPAVDSSSSHPSQADQIEA